MFLYAQCLQNRDWIQIRLRYDRVDTFALWGVPTNVIDADALCILLGVLGEPRVADDEDARALVQACLD